MRGRVLARAVQAAGDGLVERVDQQRRLAAAGDAGHRGEGGERNRGRDVLQIVAGRAGDGELAGLGDLAAMLRHLDLKRAGQVLSGERGGVRHDVPRRAFGDDVAAVDAGGRADVDHMVGRKDRLLVVLDDDHGVAEVAQVFQRFEQAGVVALVQADRGLVEHVEHAGQPRADLARRGGCAGSRRRRACRNCAASVR